MGKHWIVMGFIACNQPTGDTDTGEAPVVVQTLAVTQEKILLDDVGQGGLLDVLDGRPNGFQVLICTSEYHDEEEERCYPGGYGDSFLANGNEVWINSSYMTPPVTHFYLSYW